ncbi:hypothetical protein OH77DRAFT_1432340 [Trametes cingulata]|nr:hypothetical protein OH77DRAFT_1432340 [Trametes cingulata]
MEATMVVNGTISLASTLVGISLTSALFGVLLGQVSQYFRIYWRDPLRVRSLVSTLLLLDASQQVLYIVQGWQALVQNYGRREGPSTAALRREESIQFILNTLIILVAQSFHCRRVSQLSRGINGIGWPSLLYGPCWFLTCSTFACSIALFVESVLHPGHESALLLRAEDTSGLVMNALTAATDVTHTLTLSFVLLRYKSGSTGGQRVVRRIIFLSANAGLLTAIHATLALCTSILSKSKLHTVFYLVGCRIYSNTILGGLLSRRRLRSYMENNLDMVTLPLQELTPASVDTHFTVCEEDLQDQVAHSPLEEYRPQDRLNGSKGGRKTLNGVGATTADSRPLGSVEMGTSRR